MLQSFAYYAQFMLYMLSILIIYKFNILFLLCYLNYKIMSISSLSSSSKVQYAINNSSTHVYKHFELIFVAFATLFNTRFDKIITTDSPKSHNPVKSVHFIHILPIMLAIVAYYAGIMLNAFIILLCSKLCWHNTNSLKPSISYSLH